MSKENNWHDYTYCKQCNALITAGLEFCNDSCKALFSYESSVFRDNSDKERFLKYFETLREMEAFVMGAEYANGYTIYKENEQLKKENKALKDKIRRISGNS